MIDAMYQADIDRALDDQVARPRTPVVAAPGFSFMGLVKSPVQGAYSGAVKSLAFGAEMVGAFGDVLGAYPEAAGYSPTGDARKQANEARDKLLKQGPSFSSGAGDMLRGVARDTMPDPQTTHWSAQLLAGAAGFFTQAAGYTLATGPLIGPTLLAGDFGMAEADRLKQQGVDIGTRTFAGAAAGLLAGATTAVPLSGATALVRGIKGAASGEVANVGTALAEKLILQHAGYDKLADQFDPLDPVGLALGLVPGALGAKFGKPKPLLKQADVRDAVQLSPAEQARSDAFERSAGNLAELEAAIKAEKNPANRALLEAELTKQRTAAAGDVARAALEQRPELEAAARVRQTADALDATRLTPDMDLAGRDAHLSAVELASEQMARGERVEVSSLAEPPSDPAARELSDRLAALEAQRAELLPAAGNLADRGEIAGIRQELALLEQNRPDTSDAGIKVLAKQIQAADGVGYKSALAEARRQAADAGAQFDARSARLNDAIERNAQAQQAHGQLAELDRSIGDLRRQRDQMAPFLAFRSAVAEAARLTLDQPRTREPASARTPPQAPNREAPPAAGGAGAASPAAPAAAAGRAAADLQAAGVSRAAQEVAALNPDMLVHMDGMDAPVRVGDLLERVRKEAAADVRDSRLLQVAAECAIRSM